VVLKAWKTILACQQENGKVGWVQIVGKILERVSF
jgi:hypothetical protein